jgi:hypothetical protein
LSLLSDDADGEQSFFVQREALEALEFMGIDESLCVPRLPAYQRVNEESISPSPIVSMLLLWMNRPTTSMFQEASAPSM